MTAIRETFEETGILLASNPVPTEDALLLASSSIRPPFPTEAQMDAARSSVHAQKLLFRDFMTQFKLIPDIASLNPFTQWITPPIFPK